MVVLLGAERIAEIELETETGSKNLLSPPVFAVVLIAIKMLTCMWGILVDEDCHAGDDNDDDDDNGDDDDDEEMVR